MTKQIYWSDGKRGKEMFERHFAGRPGVQGTLVERESGAAAEGHAAGFYLDLSVELADAWDRGLRAAKVNRDGRGRERIETELDAVTTRK